MDLMGVLSSVVVQPGSHRLDECSTPINKVVWRFNKLTIIPVVSIITITIISTSARLSWATTCATRSTRSIPACPRWQDEVV